MFLAELSNNERIVWIFQRYSRKQIFLKINSRVLISGFIVRGSFNTMKYYSMKSDLIIGEEYQKGLNENEMGLKLKNNMDTNRNSTF